MRAVVVERFGSPDVLKVVQRDDPAPVPTEIRVRVRAAGVNLVDYKTRQGSGMASVLGEPAFMMVERKGRGPETRYVASEGFRAGVAIRSGEPPDDGGSA